MRKRTSATIRKSASAEQKHSFVSAEGPWRKNGGGVRSRVPSAIVAARPCFSSLGSKDGAEPLHALERHAAAANDAGERIFGDKDGQAGLLGKQAVEIAQQRAAASEHHAALGDVGTELGGSLLERVLDARDDLVERVGQRLEDLV